MKTIALFATISIFCLLLVSAQETKDAGKELPAGIKDEYSNPKFYLTTDPATWNWDRVHVNNPAVYQNKKLYEPPFTLSKNFDKIPATMYARVRFEELSFSDLPYKKLFPEFHATLAEKRAALQKYCNKISNSQCTINIQTNEANNVRFSSTGIKAYTDSATLKKYPANTLFSVENGRIIVKIPEQKVIRTDMLGDDTFHLEQEKILTIQHQTPNGIEQKQITGSLEYNQGTWMLPAQKIATINSVELTTTEEAVIYGLGGTQDTELNKLAAFFETRQMYEYLRAKQKPAIFLGQNKIYAVTAQCETCDINADTFRITFKPGNPYYTMDEGNNYYQQFPDRLAIIPIKGGGIVSGAQQLTIIGKVRMENGAHTIHFDNGEGIIKTTTGTTTNYDTVPLYLHLHDDKFQKSRIKDTSVDEPKNIMEINENNLIRYKNKVHVSFAIDPAHIVSEPESGLEVVRNLNTHQNFAIIIQTPYDAGMLDEKPYFEASTELLVLNTQKEQKPLVLKMENADDLMSQDQQKRLETHKRFLEELNEKQKVLQKEKQPFDFYVIGHSKLDIVQEGDIQIRIADGHFKGKDGKTKTDTVQLNYQTGIIGSSLGELKLQKLKEETVKELIKEDILKKEEHYKDKNGLLILRGGGQQKARQRLKQKLNTNKEIQGQLYKIDYEEGEIKMTIHPTRAPIFTAIQLIKKKYPELKEKSASEILISPQMQQIEFPSCSYLRLVSELAKRTTGKIISYRCKSH